MMKWTDILLQQSVCRVFDLFICIGQRQAEVHRDVSDEFEFIGLLYNFSDAGQQIVKFYLILLGDWQAFLLVV